jgi:hypothetical protein
MYYVFYEHQRRSPSIIIEAGNSSRAYELAKDNFSVHFRVCQQCGDNYWHCYDSDGFTDLEAAYRVASKRSEGKPELLKVLDRLENIGAEDLARLKETVMNMGYRTVPPTDEEILELWASIVRWSESKEA